MDATDLLITVSLGGPIVGAVVGALVSPGVTRALGALASARAQRIEHVAATGTQLFSYGVPLDEAQFREAYAAYRAVQDRQGPAAERNRWQAAEGVDAVRKFSVLTGTAPAAFPMLGEEDSAWKWYAENNHYAIREFPERHGWKLQPPGTVET